jgi:2-polyprenyl-3-methyl-5-hydroxy-6-metoxy-1,4-benzoquinol methylase
MTLTFEQDYFSSRKYSLKEEHVKRHVLEVIRWAGKIANCNLLNGEGKRALDVGCAYGYTSKILTELGYETFGVDISKWGINQAKNLSRGQFLVCDAQTKMPFKNATFDLITCFDVLEHLPYPEKALLSMSNACKNTIVCTTPNKKVEKIVRKLMRDYDETHINVKSPSEWQKFIDGNLEYSLLKVQTFYDLVMKSGAKLFFKSFSIPNYGLTVRIIVKK